MSDLFEKNTLVVNQKFTVIANQYQVLDESGAEIGFVQENMSTAKKALSFIVSKKVMPFELNILDNEKKVLATISRGVTLLLSKTSIKNANGEEIAKINQKFTMLKPKFEIVDTQGQLIATIQGDWKAWDFHITTPEGTEIGTVSKQWNGALKEIFTDSDKYVVNINGSLEDRNKRIAIISTAIVVDMILKENN
ncbi:MAG: hypothetical protein II716_03155 [Treponema sp.]|nr:hypothetical protein [Treponema sp.]